MNDEAALAQALHLARVLKEQKKFDGAIEAFRRAIDLRPDYAAVWYNLANLFFQLERYPEAAAAYARVTEIEPSDRDGWFYLGVSVLRQGDFSWAAGAFQRAVNLDPQNAASQQQLAFATHSCGQIDVAERAYEQFLRLKIGDPSAIYSLGLIWLARGDFVRGWPAYEMRRALPDKRPVRQFAEPEWNGEPLAGRTILLHSEQGLGDTLQFIRFAPRVAAAGGRIILVCPRVLVRLLENQLEIQQVIADGDVMPAFDLQAPLMSLPRILRATPQTFYAGKSYLQIRVEDADEFRDLTAVSGTKVGLCWAGNPANSLDAVRSIALDAFAPIAAVPDVRLFSLQVGNAATQVRDARFPIVDLHERFTDLSKAASLIDQLDLVITVDTAIAHLAGALGKPTWLLTSIASDWRWLLDRRDSPWYPSMRIFRQPVLHDWDSVISAVVRELKEKRWNC